MRLPRPLMIAFEGIDGSGKSTQIKALGDRLRSEGLPVDTTCEPTQGPIGALIRDAFNHRLDFDDRVVAGLFVADRLHHLLDTKEGMLAKMKEGNTVLCDRYYLSSFAYQGAHMPMEWVIQANALSRSLLKPDIHIYIQINPETAMDRLASGRTSLERYETLANLKLVQEKYLEAMNLLDQEENFFVANGNQPKHVVSEAIWNALNAQFFTQ